MVGVPILIIFIIIIIWAVHDQKRHDEQKNKKYEDYLDKTLRTPQWKFFTNQVEENSPHIELNQEDKNWVIHHKNEDWGTLKSYIPTQIRQEFNRFTRIYGKPKPNRYQ